MIQDGRMLAFKEETSSQDGLNKEAQRLHFKNILSSSIKAYLMEFVIIVIIMGIKLLIVEL